MNLETPIYLDYNATTPVDPDVLQAMLPFFTRQFGNEASVQHAFGHAARQAVEQSSQQVAQLINADPREIIWTSGATESNNLALKGAAAWYQDKGRHIISAKHEHLAVIDPLKRLEKSGYEITWLSPDRFGVIDAQQVRQAIRDDTILVSLMWAHNEIGSINPIPAIGHICREKNILLHTDATQYIARYPINVNEAGIDLLSASAHKFYGPKGAGCLYVRRKGPRARLDPLFDGGGHQRGLRSGTLNVPGIVGMGAAAALCGQLREEDAVRLRQLRDHLENLLSTTVPDIQINGRPDGPQTDSQADESRLYQTSNISFAGVDALQLMKQTPELAISSGAACGSASGHSTRSLRSIGLTENMARAALRISLGRWTSKEQIDQAAAMLADTVEKLRRSDQAAECGI